MPSSLSALAEFMDSSVFGIIRIVAVSYIGLLWIAIIVWVTRDAINRSTSLLFQTFTILLNILVPFLGLLLYLIIRPGKTNMERYYEDLERRLLLESNADKTVTCEKCLTMVDKNFAYCPGCGQKMKKVCPHCKESFQSQWNICPHCGQEYSEEPKTKAKPPKHRGRLIATRTKAPPASPVEEKIDSPESETSV